jgi:hypothetical protein
MGKSFIVFNNFFINTFYFNEFVLRNVTSLYLCFSILTVIRNTFLLPTGTPAMCFFVKYYKRKNLWGFS